MQYWSDRLRAAVRTLATGQIKTDGDRHASHLAQWAVLVVLADVALESGEVPETLYLRGDSGARAVPTTVGGIALLVDLSERATGAALAALKDAGLITVESVVGRAHRYSVAWDALGPTPSYRATPSSRPTTATIAEDSPQPLPAPAARTAEGTRNAGATLLMDSIGGFEEGYGKKGSVSSSAQAPSDDAADLVGGASQVSIPPPPPTQPSGLALVPAKPAKATRRVEVVDPATDSAKGRRKNDVQAVIAHWRAAPFHKRMPKDTPARRKRVEDRFKEGFTVEELKLALDGAYHDDFLMGREPGKPKAFHDLETILRDAGQVERLRDLGEMSLPVTDPADLVEARTWCQNHRADPMVIRIVKEQRGPMIRELEAMRRGGKPAPNEKQNRQRGGHIVQPRAAKPGWQEATGLEDIQP